MMNIQCFYIIICVILICSCKEQSTATHTQATDIRGLLNEDSIELQEVKSLQDKIKNSVIVDIETTPVSAKSLEDAADDPAIWFNAETPNKSVVYGSNKRGGIVAYDLEGIELNYYPVGNVNNIDVIELISSSDETVHVLGCTNRSSQTIDLFYIKEDGDLIAARKSQFKVNSTEIDDVYGFCFGRDVKNGKDYLFVNGKNGRMEQYAIQKEGDTIGLDRIRIVEFEDQTEGMVVDENTGTLYVGAENTGIWKLSFEANSTEHKTLITSSTKENEFIKFDLEGLALLTYRGQTFLLASSQGNYSYAIFNLSDGDKYLTSFKIIPSSDIDGVEETDGIDISTDSLGPRFPNGIFVAQDGYNFEGDTILPQNFKYLGLEKIHGIIDAF